MNSLAELVLRLRGIEPCNDLVALRRQAADVIERAERSFAALIRAIEREGFEVLSDVKGETYSVRPREPKD